jgi:membrane protein implicated in regulation of membrane protease activity
MTLETFYLSCFIAGFTFSVLSFFSGFLHLNLHMPRSFHAGGGAAHAGHGAGAHAGHGHGASRGTSNDRQAGGSNFFSFFNPMTIAAFLTWFGGAGYLAVRRHWLLLTGLSVASVAGLVGAGIVFWFLAKFLMKHDYTMDPADYEMVGVLGRVGSSIRENGTGEMIFEQMGTRRVCAARSEIREPLTRGTEIVVTRYERGVAYVRRWDDLANEYGAGNQDRELKS